jgi:peptidoglycan/xylan/chitin deacetylase (PgdA/CDA1 family)
MKLSILFLLIAANITFGFKVEKAKSIELKTNHETADSITIQLWFEAKGSAFSFTFDDGYITDYEYAQPTLDNFGYKGTYYVITGSLTDTLPAIWRYGTWQQFKVLHSEGNEIGSHTVTHPYLTQLDPGDTLTPHTIEYEVYHSKKVIDSIFTDTKCITFAYPYVDYNSIVINIVKKYYESARALDNDPNPPSLYGNQYYTLTSKEEDFDLPRNTPADDYDEFIDATNWLQQSIDSSGWAILMIHEVFPFDSIQEALAQNSWYPMSIEWLTQLCQWIQNKNIWVATVADITKYMHERECAVTNLLSQSDDSIYFNLTDTLNNSIYNFPLTVDVPVPSNWDSVFVYQNSHQKESHLLNEGGSKIARTNVIPDDGEVLVTNSRVVSVQNNNNNTPRKFALYQNYPNPFNPTTNITYQIPKPGNVELKVYDILGREVITLGKGYRNAGKYTVYFNGSKLASGIYIYTLRSGSFTQSKKMILAK